MLASMMRDDCRQSRVDEIASSTDQICDCNSYKLGTMQRTCRDSKESWGLFAKEGITR